MAVSKKTTKKNATKTKGRSDAFDLHIGQKLKSIRAIKKMTQQELAASLGVTFQQVQKYELGLNRISATRLYAIAKVLNVNVVDLYDGYETKGATSSFLLDIEKDRELAALIQSWQGIKNKELKKTVLKLFRTMLKTENNA